MKNQSQMTAQWIEMVDLSQIRELDSQLISDRKVKNFPVNCFHLEISPSYVNNQKMEEKFNRVLDPDAYV